MKISGKNDPARSTPSRAPESVEQSDGIEPHRPKPYVSVAELAALTPFSELSIRTMMARGILKKDVHYFDVGRRRVFKWQAVVDFIEHGGVEDLPRIPLYGGGHLGESEDEEA
jgi:hypothetical protein